MSTDHRPALAPNLGLPGKNIKLGSSTSAANPKKQPDPPLVPAIKVDTNVSRHNGASPEQLFPGSSTNDSPPSLAPHTKKKKKGHVPARLNLSKELSPFGREVPIVLSVPLNSAPVQYRPSPGNHRQQQSPSPRQPCTPSILITPTGLSPTLFSSHLRSRRVPKPASSIYTRAASILGKSSSSPDVAPPVPGLPKQYNSAQTPSWTTIQRHSSPSRVSEASANHGSPGSVQDENDLVSAQSAPDPMMTSSKPTCGHRGSDDAILPTPRRSRGWWNVLTSPFFNRDSTSSLSRCKSQPLVDDDAPEVPMLDRAAPMSDSHTKTLEDGTNPSEVGHHRALRNASSISFDMTTPKTGEAAKYYDKHRNFDDSPEQRAAQLPDAQKADEQVGRAVSTFRPEASHRDNKPHGLLGTNVNDRDSRIVVYKPGKFHEIISPVGGPENKPFPVFDNHNPHDRQSKDFFYRRPKSPRSVASSFFPVVEQATVGHFKSARKVHGTPNRDNTPSSVASEWPIKTGKTTAYPPREDSKHNRPPSRVYATANLQPLRAHHRSTKWGSAFVEKIDHTAGHCSPKRERNFLITVAATLTVILLLIVLLALFVVRKHDDIPVQSQWLSVTNFPPVPTGISTIIKPNIGAKSDCTTNQDLWQCSIPKAQQQDAQKDASQPNFRLEIRSRVIPPKNSTSQEHAKRGISKPGSSVIETHDQEDASILTKRDNFKDFIMSPFPRPPSIADIAFLGNTTSKVAKPYSGEKTPFTISLLSIDQAKESSIAKRDESATDKSRVPPPEQLSNGTAAPAMAYPLPSSQPLRLFNRGRQDEHYGFFTYFDKSVLLDLPIDNSGRILGNPNADNMNGGVGIGKANARCTFSQTRFFVQIWTRASPQTLLGPANTTSGNSTATDFNRPGSFPLPVTINVDRHGGDSEEKGVFCYGLHQDGSLNSDALIAVDEDRSKGGRLVNPAPGPFARTQNDREGKSEWGGSDGGTGGCWCAYSNFK